MAGDRVIYGGGDASALSQRQKHKIYSHDQSPDSFFASCPSNPFLGSRAMVSFGGVTGVKRSVSSFYGSLDQEEIAEEYLDEYLNQQAKKRRLSVEQVQFLERNFETENKLEPDRKIQLAKELGLKPRQIAIWFQNRRARWKTQQMETDYETLHSSYENLKTEFDNILKENEKLKAEVLHLKHNGISENKKKANFELCDCQQLLSDETPEKGTTFIISEAEESDQMSAVAFKNEERTLTRSDVTDVDNPHLTEAIHSSFLQSRDSSHLFELNHPYASKNREDNLDDDDDELLQQLAYTFHGFPVEDHHAFSFWSY